MVAPNEVVTITRTTAGPATDAAGAAAIFAVLGTAAAGDVDKPFLARQDRDPSAVYTGGPVVEVSEIVAAYSGQSVIPVRLATATPATYGDVDLADVTGTLTVTADASVVPWVDSELYVIIDRGGVVGSATSGIAYRTSVDGGNTRSTRAPLGGATSISFPTVNARLLLNIPTTSQAPFIAYVTDIRAQVLDHFALSATTHNAADVTSGTGIGPAPTTVPEARDCINQIRAALVLHVANTPTVHNIADTLSFAGMPPAATDTVTGLALAVFIASRWENHLDNTAAHDTADTVNLITAPAPALATVNAGDVIRVQTIGPKRDDAGLAAGLAALLAFKGSLFGAIAIPGTFDPANEWPVLIEGLDNLRRNHVPIGCVLIEAREPAANETPTQYRLALEAEWANYADERVHVIAGQHGRYDPNTLPRAGAQFRRSHLAPLAARLAALDFGESPALTTITGRNAARPSVFGGPLAGYRVYDDAGNRIGHDEAMDPGLSDASFGVVTSYRRVPSPLAAYVFQPNNKAPTGNRAPHIAHQRVLAVIESIIYEVGTNAVQRRNLTDGASTIRDDVAEGLNSEFRSAILRQVGDPTASQGARISDLKGPFVDTNAIINQQAPIIPVYGEVTTAFYTAGFDFNIQANRS